MGELFQVKYASLILCDALGVCCLGLEGVTPKIILLFFFLLEFFEHLIAQLDLFLAKRCFFKEANYFLKRKLYNEAQEMTLRLHFALDNDAFAAGTYLSGNFHGFLNACLILLMIFKSDFDPLRLINGGHFI